MHVLQNRIFQNIQEHQYFRQRISKISNITGAGICINSDSVNFCDLFRVLIFDRAKKTRYGRHMRLMLFIILSYAQNDGTKRETKRNTPCALVPMRQFCIFANIPGHNLTPTFINIVTQRKTA